MLEPQHLQEPAVFYTIPRFLSREQSRKERTQFTNQDCISWDGGGRAGGEGLCRVQMRTKQASASLDNPSGPLLFPKVFGYL